MEENKITISLERYLEEHDHTVELENIIDTIIDYVLSHSELENGELKIDYNFRYSHFLTDIVKKNYPAKYNKRLEELKKEEEYNVWMKNIQNC